MNCNIPIQLINGVLNTHSEKMYLRVNEKEAEVRFQPPSVVALPSCSMEEANNLNSESYNSMTTTFMKGM